MTIGEAVGQINTQSTSPLAAYGNGANMKIVDMPPPPPELDNSLYLSEDWQPGSVLLEIGSIIENCSLRYDIANGYIEIKGENTVRAAAEKDVAQFTINTLPKARWFINASQFGGQKKTKYNLMEVLVDGEIKLLYSSKVEIIKPNGGFTDQRRAMGDPITSRKIEKFYLVQNGNLFDANSKGKLLDAFGEKTNMMKSYAKAKGLGFSKQEDLIALVQHYSAIAK